MRHLPRMRSRFLGISSYDQIIKNPKRDFLQIQSHFNEFSAHLTNHNIMCAQLLSYKRLTRFEIEKNAQNNLILNQS